MHSLVLFRIEKLAAKGIVESSDHRPRGTRERDTPPVFTRVDLTDKKVARSYSLAGITHREGAVLQALWRNQYINECVLVFTPEGYYNRTKKLFIIEAPAYVARAIALRMRTDRPQDMTLRPVALDFDALLQRNPKDRMQILGAWTRHQKTPIRSRAAFAQADMRAQGAFKDMRESGNLSTLSVRLSFQDTSLRVSLSRWASAVIYGEVPLETRIEFMEHLAGYVVSAKKNKVA